MLGAAAASSAEQDPLLASPCMVNAWGTEWNVFWSAHGTVLLCVQDECHATGFMGKSGRGTDEHFGILGEVDIVNSTLGKAMGGATGARKPLLCCAPLSWLLCAR